MTVTVEVTASNIAGSNAVISAPVTITNPLPVPTTWIPRVSGTSQTLPALASSGSEAIALSNAAAPDMVRTTDGISWAPVVGHGVAQGSRSVVFANGTFLAVAGGPVAANKLKRSTDGGLTWTSPSHPITGSNTIYDSAYGAGVFVVVALTGPPTTIRSTNDAASFTAATTGITFNPTSVVYGNGVFVAGGLSGEIATSTDGDVWVNQTSVLTQQVNRVRFGGGVFIAVAGAGQIAKSTDGITWARVDIPTMTGAWAGVAYYNHVWLIVSTSNTGHYSTDNGSSWISTPITGAAAAVIDGRWIVTGESGAIQTSDF